VSGVLARIANRSLDTLFFPVMDTFWRGRAEGRLVCFLYHRVASAGVFPFIEKAGASAISPDALSEELKFLRDQGARFMSFADLRRGEFPAKKEIGVIVSFDDGFRDNYEAGLDVLDSFGISGVIFQSSALVDSQKLIWEHALYWIADNPAMYAELEKRTHAAYAASASLTGNALVHYLRESVPVAEVESLLSEITEQGSAAQAQALLAEKLYPTAKHLRMARDRGHEIGSHGHRHYMRVNIDATVFEYELRRSSQRLGDILGEPPAAFSYPFNSYLPGDREICERYYQQIVTVDGKPISQSGSPFEIPRFSWPGPARNRLRQRRWLWTGKI